MFHIANKIYLEYDYKFHQQYPYIVASERWSKHPITISKSPLVSQVSSFEELLLNNYNNDIENFWTDLLNREGKIVVFLDPQTVTKLQFQYWKSIFQDSITLENLHLLHTSWIESMRLTGYFDLVGTWDPGTESWTRSNAYTELPIPTLQESQSLYNSTTVSPTLRNMNKTTLSLEYLLADYLYNPNTIYKQVLMEKIKKFTWDNWMDELMHLRYEVLTGNLDLTSIDRNLNISVGNIEQQLSTSNILKWVVDPAFNRDNVEYIRSTYDHQIFNPCWDKTYELWSGGDENMAELNDLINTDQYEELLNRDIARGFGCSYTAKTFYTKSNLVFSTYCYQKKREGKTEDLSNFALHV